MSSMSSYETGYDDGRRGTYAPGLRAGDALADYDRGYDDGEWTAEAERRPSPPNRHTHGSRDWDAEDIAPIYRG